ncbi:MAG: alpha/beta hydrolase [Pseudomonadota bacterium]
MSAGHVIFSHGRDSGPVGGKITAMAQRATALGWTTESIDYRGMADPKERVAKLVAVPGVRDHARLVLAGSSMGGHVAAAAALELHPAGLFLLAPAFYMPGYEALTPAPAPCPCNIVHGLHDDVVPVENSLRYAKAASASLLAIDSDHRLLDAIELVCDHLERFLLSLTPST